MAALAAARGNGLTATARQVCRVCTFPKRPRPWIAPSLSLSSGASSRSASSKGGSSTKSRGGTSLGDGDQSKDSKESKDGTKAGTNGGNDGNNGTKTGTKASSKTTSKNSLEKYSCMHGGTLAQLTQNPNLDTIALLQAMADAYDRQGNPIKVGVYRRAVAGLRRQPERVQTLEQARAVPHVGDGIARHIVEIVETGRFAQLDEALADPLDEARRLFYSVQYAGSAQIQNWISQGFRTLDDVRTKAKLTRNQSLCLEHYDDLLIPIPREEVMAIEAHVRQAAIAIDAGVQLIVGGSHRRGAPTSADVDFIVTREGTTSPDDLGPFLNELISKLGAENFITDHLATRRAGGNKWQGFCVPPSPFPNIWRRIDFLLVPATELGAGLIYFTGNDAFVRSMRDLADKECGMSLTHRGLYENVVRDTGTGRPKIEYGDLVEGKDEKRIFELLGVPYRSPQERWC